MTRTRKTPEQREANQIWRERRAELVALGRPALVEMILKLDPDFHLPNASKQWIASAIIVWQDRMEGSK